MKTGIRRPRVLFLRRSVFRQPKLPRIERSEWAFFISYALFLFYMILSVSFYLVYIKDIWKPFFVFCIGMLGLSELIRNGMTWKNILHVAVIMLLFVMIMRVGEGMSQNSIAGLMLYIYCARGISFRKIARVTILVSGLALALVVGGAYAGIIRNYVAPGSRKRAYLGFLYALNGPTIMSNITLLWIWLKKEKITVTGAAVFAAANFVFFRLSDSRLCFILTVLMIGAALFLKRWQPFLRRRKILCRGMVCSFVLTAAASLWLTVRYNPAVGWMAKLNSLLGKRLALGQASLRQIGAGWFGIRGIQWVGNGLNMYGEKNTDTYLYVDNYYIQIMQRFGILFLIAAVAFLTFAAYRCLREGDLYLLCILTVLAAHFMIDNLYMYLHYNTFWFAVGALVFARLRTVPAVAALTASGRRERPGGGGSRKQTYGEQRA